MTRINVGIPPRELSVKHLIAEHREIKRIPNRVKKGGVRWDNIPDKFCLGKGHVTFFYNKLGYLLNRYKEIYAECIRRGYKVTCYENAWDGLKLDDWQPTESDIEIIRNRLNNNFALSK